MEVMDEVRGPMAGGELVSVEEVVEVVEAEMVVPVGVPVEEVEVYKNAGNQL